MKLKETITCNANGTEYIAAISCICQAYLVETFNMPQREQACVDKA